MLQSPGAPSLQEIIKDEQKWAKLGVVLPSGSDGGPFFSEVGMLRLVPPQLAGGATTASAGELQRRVVRPAKRVPADRRDRGDRAGDRTGDRARRDGAAAAGTGATADERAESSEEMTRGDGSGVTGDSEAWQAVAPAKPSEEIWERHGWDSMDGSWKGFPW